MRQATAAYITNPSLRELDRMLAPFFTRRPGDAPTPALPTPTNNRPAPAAARALELA